MSDRNSIFFICPEKFTFYDFLVFYEMSDSVLCKELIANQGELTRVRRNLWE